jgi:hypothetical protein
LVSRPPLPEEGPIQADPASATSEAPEADDCQDGDDAEISREESGSTSLPPPACFEEPSLDKKRKHLDEFDFFEYLSSEGCARGDFFCQSSYY